MSFNVASKTVTPDGLSGALQATLERYERESKKDAADLMRETMRNVFGAVIEETPVGDFDPKHAGTAKANWILSSGAPSTKVYKVKKPTRDRSSLRFPVSPKLILSRRWFLSNNLDYIGVLEYGGYPKTVKKGTYNKPLDKWQKRSSGGFSKQAPKGMVRRNVSRFKYALQLAASKIF